jgi:hypothetical protein
LIRKNGGLVALLKGEINGEREFLSSYLLEEIMQMAKKSLIRETETKGFRLWQELIFGQSVQG